MNSIAGSVQGGPYIWQQPDYVEKAFIEIAFKQEYSKGLYPLQNGVNLPFIIRLRLSTSN